MTSALWIVQGLLALRFLFAGGIKVVLPLENLTGSMPSPGPFLGSSWPARSARSA